MIELKIENSLKKFNLSLKDKIVLTEAATGNYVVTPIIAALSGAKVYAYTKDSIYGSVKEIKEQTYSLAKKMGVKKNITILEDINEINLREIDVLTNTGFLRPINRDLISKLSSKCVIPLMWEPWEYRHNELDLEACYEKGIKVYGTNEDDERLRTKEYIGFIVLYHLLKRKLSPFSSKVLLIGCDFFVQPVERILKQNFYNVSKIVDYYSPFDMNLSYFTSLVILEHQRNILIIGNKKAYINVNNIPKGTFVIHICGNVDFQNKKHFTHVPAKPKQFGYMSFTADYIDIQAVIDLHAAGFKAAEGMLRANRLGLKGREYKRFMEKNHPALAFDNSKYW